MIDIKISNKNRKYNDNILMIKIFVKGDRLSC